MLYWSCQNKIIDFNLHTQFSIIHHNITMSNKKHWIKMMLRMSSTDDIIMTASLTDDIIMTASLTDNVSIIHDKHFHRRHHYRSPHKIKVSTSSEQHNTFSPHPLHASQTNIVTVEEWILQANNSTLIYPQYHRKNL